MNMILDPIFIFTLNLGVRGAATATVISQAISATWVLMYYIRKESMVPFKLKFLPPKISTAKIMFAIGLSPFLLQTLSSVVTIFMNNTLGKYGNATLGTGGGDIAIAAMVVVMSVSQLFLMPIFGINQGTQPIIGFNYGFGAIHRVKQTYKWAVIYGVIICTIGFITVEALAPFWVRIFNEAPELVETGSFGLRIGLMSLPVVAVQVISVNFLQSIGRAKISIIQTLLRQAIILIPALLLFPAAWGFWSIWFAMPFSDFCAAVIAIVLIVREFKILGKLEMKEEGV